MLQSQRSSSLETGKARIKMDKRTKQVKFLLDTPLKLVQLLGAKPFSRSSCILQGLLWTSGHLCIELRAAVGAWHDGPIAAMALPSLQTRSLSPFNAVQAKEADDLQAVLRYNLALQVRPLIILCQAGPDTEQDLPY